MSASAGNHIERHKFIRANYTVRTVITSSVVPAGPPRIVNDSVVDSSLQWKYALSELAPAVSRYCVMAEPWCLVDIWKLSQSGCTIAQVITATLLVLSSLFFLCRRGSKGCKEYDERWCRCLGLIRLYFWVSLHKKLAVLRLVGRRAALVSGSCCLARCRCV